MPNSPQLRQSKRPPRMVPFQKFEPPLWFVTIGTFNRQPILACDSLHLRFLAFARRHASSGKAIGRYVIMPDHIHFFMSLAPDFRLGATVGFLKKNLSAALVQNGSPSPHWQPGFFDHLIRSADSYSEKWHYVYQNPVRAKLVKAAEDWPYSGEVVALEF